MARTKEFDVDVVLSRATELFWEKGYENTSMQDLVEGMGVHKRSMYDTFGDKHTLFVTVLDRYVAAREEIDRDKVEKADSAVGALRALFEGSVEISGLQPRGCLVVNSATELALRDGQAADRVERHFAEQRRLLAEIVQRGQWDGEIDTRHSAEALAAMLFNAWLGLRVQARVVSDAAQLGAMVDGVLAVLN